MEMLGSFLVKENEKQPFLKHSCVYIQLCICVLYMQYM